MKFGLATFKALAAEFVCTFIFLFTICANGLNDKRMLTSTGSVSAGISTAFVAVAIIYTFGGLSGAHFNPAVTLGALVGGKIEIIRAVLYIVLQLVAGLAAVGLLNFLYPLNAADILLLSPGPGVSNLEAVIMEAVMTFILVMVIYGTVMGIKVAAIPSDIETQDEQSELVANNKAKLNFAPIAIGLTLGFLCFLGGTISGGAFNPARATAPAIISMKFTNLWIYWVGDLIGAAIGAALFHFFFETT